MHDDLRCGTLAGLCVPESNERHARCAYVLCDPAAESYQSITQYDWQPLQARPLLS
jgi:hypothetical protein